jgi:hypothetical protein
MFMVLKIVFCNIDGDGDDDEVNIGILM